MIARLVTLLPEPLSPTSPTRFARPTESDTPSTARRTPPSTGKLHVQVADFEERVGISALRRVQRTLAQREGLRKNVCPFR